MPPPKKEAQARKGPGALFLSFKEHVVRQPIIPAQHFFIIIQSGPLVRKGRGRTDLSDFTVFISCIHTHAAARAVHKVWATRMHTDTFCSISIVIASVDSGGKHPKLLAVFICTNINTCHANISPLSQQNAPPPKILQTILNPPPQRAIPRTTPPATAAGGEGTADFSGDGTEGLVLGGDGDVGGFGGGLSARAALPP